MWILNATFNNILSERFSKLLTKNMKRKTNINQTLRSENPSLVLSSATQIKGHINYELKMSM